MVMVSKLWCHVDLVLWCGGLMIMVMGTMFYMINNTDPRCPMTQWSKPLQVSSWWSVWSKPLVSGAGQLWSASDYWSLESILTDRWSSSHHHTVNATKQNLNQLLNSSSCFYHLLALLIGDNSLNIVYTNIWNKNNSKNLICTLLNINKSHRTIESWHTLLRTYVRAHYMHNSFDRILDIIMRLAFMHAREFEWDDWRWENECGLIDVR